MKPAGASVTILIFLLSTNLSCTLFNTLAGRATPTATTPPPSATATATPLPPTASSTPAASATPVISVTASPDAAASTATLASSGISYPVTFEITLNAPATMCGDALSSNFTVTLTDTTISMTQHEYQLTTSGPYDSNSGNFTSTRAGLPGTQTYTGVLTLTPAPAGVSVSMNGQFTYTGDPDYTCPVADNFSGQATISP